MELCPVKDTEGRRRFENKKGTFIITTITVKSSKPMRIMEFEDSEEKTQKNGIQVYRHMHSHRL